MAEAYLDTVNGSDWDRFVDSTRGSHYSQKSIWARVKSVEGWQALRILVRNHEEILAGVQILHRPVGLLGRVGYAPFGILNPGNELQSEEAIIKKVQEVCKLKHILYFTLPYQNGSVSGHLDLENLGFHKGAFGDIDLPCTNCANLSLTEQEIIQEMDKNKRSQVRSSLKRGLSFHEGGRDQIAMFYHFHQMDGERLGYTSEKIAFYYRLWDEFSPHGQVKLFYTQDEGKPINALFVIIHQDRAYDFKIGWSGEGKLKYPNEAIRWGAMVWAKEHGCTVYDFGGLPRWSMEIIQHGKPYPEKFIHSYACFKYRMGSHLEIYPPLYDYVCDPVLDWGVRHVLPGVMKIGAVKKVLNLRKKTADRE